MEIMSNISWKRKKENVNHSIPRAILKKEKENIEMGVSSERKGNKEIEPKKIQVRICVIKSEVYKPMKAWEIIR